MGIVPVPVLEAHATYAAIGKALATWAHVESHLSLAFYALSGTKTAKQAAAITDTIVSFDTRIDVLNALFAIAPHNDADGELWNKVIARCRKLYKKRHRLAHFRLVAADSKDGSCRADIAPFFSYNAWVNETQIYLTRDQISDLTTKFSEMEDALLWILGRLIDRTAEQLRVNFEQDHEEPSEISRLRVLALQTLLEREQRPQS